MVWVLLFVLAGILQAHVGSPDVFFEGKAGPYPLFVTIRPPAVIPGVAEVEIRSGSPEVDEIRITPMPLTGDGAKFAPTPDLAQRSRQDAQFYTGSIWMMRSGSWQVRVEASGSGGSGRLSVPVPAFATRTAGMQFALGALLCVLMAVLSVGLVSIVGAGVREAQLEPGIPPPPGNRRRARIVMGITAVFVAGLLYLGNAWWSAEAGAYSRYVYKPLEMTASLEGEGRLVLRLRDPGWLRMRRLEDFIPDHTHLMHMYLIRLPGMERVWHLHPEMTAAGIFEHRLPPVPAGRYQIFADVVHSNGFPETLVAQVDLPDVEGVPLSGDDSAGSGPALSETSKDIAVARLSGGARMIWERSPEPVEARKPYGFRFRVEDEEGKPASDLELYMGMPGHAAFVRTDLSVFAHVHPSGSVPMAALGLAEQADPHAAHAMQAAPPPVVTFPYGFPKPGDYRIFVQVKRAGTVETGIFDARVE